LEITDGEGGYYRGNFAYDLVKNMVIRMAKAMAADAAGRQFSPEGFADGTPRATSLTVAALTPGFLRSEEMLSLMGVTEANWQDAKDRTFATQSETPRYIGRAVAALASDPNRSRFNGHVLSSWRLMREYGFTDVDGRQPDWGAYFAATHADQHPEL
jgi:NAD(P)-dependent dehydrogenase (short-subunit alcohol dehydrogenase family)